MFSSRPRYHIQAPRDHSAILDIIDYNDGYVHPDILDNLAKQEPVSIIMDIFEKIDMATDDDHPCHFARNWVDLVSGKPKDIQSELSRVVRIVSRIVGDGKDKTKSNLISRMMSIRLDLLKSINSDDEPIPNISLQFYENDVLNLVNRSFFLASCALLKKDKQAAMIYVTIGDIALGVVRYQQWLNKQ